MGQGQYGPAHLIGTVHRIDSAAMPCADLLTSWVHGVDPRTGV